MGQNIPLQKDKALVDLKSSKSPTKYKSIENFNAPLRMINENKGLEK